MCKRFHGWRLVIAGGVLACLVGCGTSRDDLGNIVYSIPTVPGADTPYELPDLGVGAASPPAEEAADPHAGHEHD